MVLAWRYLSRHSEQPAIRYRNQVGDVWNVWDSPFFVIPGFVFAVVVGSMVFTMIHRALKTRRRQKESEREKPEYWYLRGLKDRNNGKITKAIAHFSDALLRDSRHPGAWSEEYRLLTLIERGQLWVQKDPPAHKFAIEDFTEAIHISSKLATKEPGYGDPTPSIGELYHHRASFHATLGMLDEAIQDLTATIDHLISLADESGGRLIGLTDVTGRFSRMVNSYTYRGNLYKESGRYEKAVENYTEQIDFFAKYAPGAVAGAYHDRALTYFEWGRLKLSLDDLDRVIREYQETDPADVPVDLIAQREVVLAQLRNSRRTSRNS